MQFTENGNQSTNGQSTNGQSTNGQSTNGQSTNGQSTNDQQSIAVEKIKTELAEMKQTLSVFQNVLKSLAASNQILIDILKQINDEFNGQNNNQSSE